MTSKTVIVQVEEDNMQRDISCGIADRHVYILEAVQDVYEGKTATEILLQDVNEDDIAAVVFDPCMAWFEGYPRTGEPLEDSIRAYISELDKSIGDRQVEVFAVSGIPEDKEGYGIIQQKYQDHFLPTNLYGASDIASIVRQSIGEN